MADTRRSSTAILGALLLALAIAPFPLLITTPCPPCEGNGIITERSGRFDTAYSCRLCGGHRRIRLGTRWVSDLSPEANHGPPLFTTSSLDSDPRNSSP